MGRCLRCDKPCSESSIFCDECRPLLQEQLHQREHMNVAGSSDGVATRVMLSSDIAENEACEVSNGQDNSTIPCPVIEEPRTSLPPLYDSYATIVDQALRRLDDAARRIAAVERNRPRGPRAARLTPLRDISSEVERNNTPLPGSEEGVDDERGEGEQQANNLPDLWPWLQGGDTGEQDVWNGQNDPLMTRRFPDSAEAARIEEEDMQRAIAEGLATRSLPQARRGTKRLRRAFAFLAIMAVLALTIDSVLLSMAFLRGHHPQEAPGGPPTLTLSSSVVTYGQSITVYVKHFSPSGRVFLTHDIREPLLLNTGKAILPLGQNGAAQATVFIDNNWQPGFHTIVAEDIATRYTANAMLRVAGGPTRPSHLLLGVSELDLGAAIQGANIIQPFTLHNAGNGAITWTASSDQPWLMLSPNQGVFSDSQTISVGAQTAGLKPGDYKATLTFSSDVGPPQDLLVTMTVRPLPTGASAVLTVTPAVLSFAAQSGAPDPAAQFLVVSNPGTQPLSWSLTRNTPAGPSQQATPTANANWLSISQISGVVLPGESSSIKITAQQNNLLPGTYTNILVFSANGALNSPQNVNVSFTVQPACSLALSAGSLSFTAVARGSNPSNQALNLAATQGCSGAVAWQAASSASWLKITPANGQLSGSASTTTTVGVNINGLTPGTYNATISLTTAQSTQSVSVALTVQAAPPPTAPVMGASPLNLNFTAVQGQANPPGQTVTIVNTGGGSLLWHTTVNQLASSWLGASPTGGTIAAGQTGQVTVNINASSLTPGTYVGQVVLSGSDANNAAAGGSPQTIAINLVVSAPCTLVKPSSSAVAMSGIQGTASVAPQSITLSASGSCNWPLTWKAQVPGSASWLNLSASSGSFTASGQSTTISLSPNAANLAPGTYKTQVSVSATDASHLQAQGSPQVFSVTLTVQQPCVLQVTPAQLSFSLAQGQSSQNPQTLNISETGACGGSVTWNATIDSGSSQWLALSATSGTNSGTINISADAANLAAGSYSGTITISASGSGGATIQGSPQAIPVSLTVSAPGSNS